MKHVFQSLLETHAPKLLPVDHDGRYARPLDRYRFDPYRGDWDRSGDRYYQGIERGMRRGREGSYDRIPYDSDGYGGGRMVPGRRRMEPCGRDC